MAGLAMIVLAIQMMPKDLYKRTHCAKILKVPSWDNALDNPHRALAPDGTLLITVPGISPIGREVE